MTRLWDNPPAPGRRANYGKANGRWLPVGSKRVTDHGYVLVKVADDDWRYEHRLVTGEPDGLQVHHIDGDKTNNDPSNLLPLDFVEHMRLHHAVIE